MRIDVTFVHQTPEAIKVTHEDSCDEFWLPKSQIEESSFDGGIAEEGEDGWIEIPEWLAKEKGLS